MQSRWAATERRGGSDSEDSDSEVLGGSPDLENPSSVDAAPPPPRGSESKRDAEEFPSAKRQRSAAHTQVHDVDALSPGGFDAARSPLAGLGGLLLSDFNFSSFCQRLNANLAAAVR